MRILDHSRALSTKPIPLHSFSMLPGTILFSMTQIPQISNATWMLQVTWPQKMGNPNLVSSI